MAHNVLSVATREINKGIKDDRTLIAGRLRYYGNLLENIDLEMSRIDRRIEILSEERKIVELENCKKIKLLEEERKRIGLISKRKKDVLLNEKRKKITQFNDAPKKIEELKNELDGLDSKRNKLMIDPRREQLRKLQVELKGLSTI